MMPLKKQFFMGMAYGFVLTIAMGTIAYYFITRQPERYPRPYRSQSIDWNTSQTLHPPNFAAYLSIYSSKDSAWGFESLDGKQESLMRFKGKILFINFWATWCKPCVNELPNIQQLYDSLHQNGIEFLLFTDEPKEVVVEFTRVNNLHLPMYLFDGERPEFMSSNSIPSTYILDASGRKVFALLRGAQWGDASCMNFLRGL